MVQKFFNDKSVLATFLVAVPLMFQQPATDVQRITDWLLTGDADHRAAAVQAVTESVTLQENASVRSAVKQELIRIIAERRQFEAERAAAPEGLKPTHPSGWKRGEGDAEYELALILLATKINDPSWITDLTWLAGGDSAVIDTLARWGNESIPAILARYQDPCVATHDCPALMREGLLATLAQMVQLGTVSQVNRSQIVSMARGILAESDDWELVVGALKITAASCDSTLIAAAGPVATGTKVLSESDHTPFVSRQATRVLEKCHAAQMYR